MEPTKNTKPTPPDPTAQPTTAQMAGEAFEGKAPATSSEGAAPGGEEAREAASKAEKEEAQAGTEGMAPGTSAEKELEKLKKELLEAQNLHLRARADYDNLKRRSANDYLMASSDGAISVIKKLLPVLDSFESALKQMQNAKVDKKFCDGVEMLYMQFSDILEKEGLKPIAAKGKKFDPNEHEAMTRGQSDEFDDEVVMAEFVKGYKFRDRVIRHTSVQVNSK